MPYGITQCYLPRGSGDFPAFTAADAGTCIYYCMSWLFLLPVTVVQKMF